MKAELKDRRVHHPIKKQDGDVRCKKLGQHDGQGGNQESAIQRQAEGDRKGKR